uniref:NADH-ubiquinone oxidoreductase chain 4 n=1 Tax=Polyphemus pediculus TaxID=77662 RepID=A0A7L7S166_9CRUS|nr:NADH dehydrogenase subunit 4 [Polyphemus pediculus]
MLSLMLLLLNWNLICFSMGLATLFVWIHQSSFSMGSINFILFDSLSSFLIVLTTWITFLMLLASFYIKQEEKNSNMFIALLISMAFFLILSFSTTDSILFYISFETTLIPIFLIIMGWGYQPERLKASLFLLFYTLLASLPLLLAILLTFHETGSSTFYLLNCEVKGPSLSVGTMLTVAFLIKMPIYMGHLWLPKAHVEAPVAGSMILAGILLKLGGYGLMRLLPFIMKSTTVLAFPIMTLSILGGMAASLVCLRQTDAKALVAYSSIAHMAFVLVGLFMMSNMSWKGAFTIMIAHGLCSSGLFALVGMVYSRLHTRSMVLLRGSITIAPLFTMWWFLFAVTNMAAPPSPNLAGEIMIFISSAGWLWTFTLIAGVLSFIGGGYNLYLFSATQHGNSASEMQDSKEGDYREHIILYLHLTPLIMGLLPLLSTI